MIEFSFLSRENAHKKSYLSRGTCVLACDTQLRQRGKVISSGYTFLSESFALGTLFASTNANRCALPRENDIIYCGYICPDRFNNTRVFLTLPRLPLFTPRSPTRIHWQIKTTGGFIVGFQSARCVWHRLR